MRLLRSTLMSGISVLGCSRILFLVWVFVALIAGISGPFGTYSNLGFPSRLAYWSLIAGVVILVARAVRTAVENGVPQSPAWRWELVSFLVMVPVLTAVIWLLSPQLLGLGQGGLWPLSQLAIFVSLVVAFVAMLRQAGFASHVSTGKPEYGTTRPRLWERLPPHLRCEVFRLTGRDHHVEIVTERGQTTIRMRFTDAIAEMEPVGGHCVHRSHWVTRAAISRVERESGRIFLRLANGDRVPVSRKYRPELQAAGIL